MVAHHAAGKGEVFPAAPAVEVENGGHRQAVFPGDEAADVGGEVLGQHVHRPLGEIDAGAPLVGLLIQGRARGDIVADVGDGHVEGKSPPGFFLQADAVVKIPGGLAVDGHHGLVAQVQPAFQGLLRQVRVEVGRLGQDLRRELVGQLILQNHQPGLDLGVLHVAQDLGDHSLGIEVPRGIVGHRGPDHLARGGAV